MAIKKSTIKKVKGSISRGVIGAPSTPTNDNSGIPTPDENGSLPTMPTTTNSPTTSGPNWVKPKSYDQDFEPVGIPNDDNWHHDDAHVVSEHMLNYGKHPLDVALYWLRDGGAHLKNAQPYDPQHGDYSGFDFNAPDWTKTNKEYQDAIKHPGYEGDVGQSAPSTKKPKPSGDQHASYSTGSYSPPSEAETIRAMPGSFATGITNGMTNRDKYVNY